MVKFTPPNFEPAKPRYPDILRGRNPEVAKLKNGWCARARMDDGLHLAAIAPTVKDAIERLAGFVWFGCTVLQNDDGDNE